MIDIVAPLTIDFPFDTLPDYGSFKLEYGLTNMVDTIHMGIGPLGRKMVKYSIQRNCFNIVGAVDPDPQKAGRDLGELCDVNLLGITVSSSLASLESQVVELAEAGIHILSTCEELFFPWKTQPEIAKRIDQACRKHGVVYLGTRINPGYLMDLLPTFLTGPCRSVESIKVWRVQDASVRRIPLQQKIGAGLTLEEFEKTMADIHPIASSKDL